MKLALAIFLLAAGALAQDVPLERLQALLDYDRSAVESGFLRMQGPQEPGIGIVDYSFVGPAGERVPGTLVAPRQGEPTPLILFGHWMMAGSLMRNRQEFMEEARLLARAGATCLLLDGPLIRQGAEPDPEPMNGQGPLAQVQMAKEWRAAIDLMLADWNIDPERIAYVGQSFSAGVGAMLAGVEKRIGSLVLMSNQYSFREYAYDDRNPLAVAQRKQVGDAWIDAYLAKFPFADTVHFVKHSSPAAVFLQFGEKDEPIPPHIARLGFSHFGEPKRMKLYDSGHELNADARVDRVDWLVERLGLKPVSEEAARAIPQLY
ncbi:MAG: hypothetical protein O3A53_13315 [Acidobacteria bacterium]|nr:hypothetical protein [Acidobacteriota bacterium]MDA1235766.1 hypothetical protein [Acidobacteriota bacterium]